MRYETLRAVMDLLNQFETETGQSDVKSFAVWLYYQSNKNSIVALDIPSEESEYSNQDGQIAAFIMQLSIHERHYIKTALKDTPLVSLHDFTSLAVLFAKGHQRKTDLIRMNMLEFSPGMEVLRRLLRNGLIEDYNDPNDGRSKRVRITELGKGIFLSTLDKMNHVSTLTVGKLSGEEKIQLLILLNKLRKFHEPIWEKERGTDLELLLEKYF